MINKHLGLLMGLFLFSLIFLGLVVYDKESRLTEKDYILIDALFENVKPQCVGRFVVDIPIPFNNMNDNQVFIDDFKIESKFIYPPAFKQRIELREQELRNGKTSEKNAPVLKEIIQLPDGKGVIFDRNNSGQDDLSRTLEAHVYVDHIAFIIAVDILDLSNPKYFNRKKTYENAGFSEYEMNEKPTKLAAMQSLISRLSGRKNEEIPSIMVFVFLTGLLRMMEINIKKLFHLLMKMMILSWDLDPIIRLLVLMIRCLIVAHKSMKQCH